MLWEMSTSDFILSFSFICSFAFVTGWLTDRILLSAGFGSIGNWLLILMGSYAGMFAINSYGYELRYYPYITASSIVGGAIVLLLGLCTVKRVFHV